MKSEFSLPYYFSKENRPFEKRKVRQVKKKKKPKQIKFKENTEKGKASRPRRFNNGGNYGC